MLHTYIYRPMTLHTTYRPDVNRLQYSYIIRQISIENASHGPALEQIMF